MNTTTTVTATFVRSTYWALVNALINGKTYSDTARAQQATARALLDRVAYDTAPNFQGQPIPVYHLTLTVAEAVALMALLNSRTLIWPADEVDEREYVTRTLLDAVAPAVAAAAEAEADAALYGYSD